MADALLAEKTVLAAILPDRLDLLLVATRRLTSEHFMDQGHRNLFTVLGRYYEATGGLPTAEILTASLSASGADGGRALLMAELFRTLAVTKAGDAEFRWAVMAVRESMASRTLEDALAGTMEVLKSGITPKDSEEKIRGSQPALDYLNTRISEIQGDLLAQESPEGDMRQEASDMMSDYLRRKKLRLAGATAGVRFGIATLDDRLAGLQPGNLALIFGYSSDGKSSACVQLSWSAAAEQGKNVVFLTTETLREQIRRKIIARHSCAPQFELPDGLDSSAIRDGRLTADEERKLAYVLHDFQTNSAYGRLYVAQVARKSTIASIEAQLRRIQQEFPVDLVVMDYLALLKSDTRRNTDREELSRILKEAKQVATTFNDGHGVPFVSPWQVNRTSRETASTSYTYDSTALAETAEATNTADILVGLYAMGDPSHRKRDARFSVAKNRDDPTFTVDVDVDYATSKFSPKLMTASSVNSVSELLGNAQSEILGVS